MNASLSSLYFYQNPNTNQPSSSAVSLKQLCRIICPQKTHHASSTSSNTAKNIGTRSFINPSTAVIEFDPIENKYAEAGWLLAKDVPVLREACSTWFYQETISEMDDTTTGSERTSPPGVKGPISCRELAGIYYSGGNDGSSKLDINARVWSPELASTGIESEWKKICELTSLRDAMEAFEDALTFGFDELVKGNESHKTQPQTADVNDINSQPHQDDEGNNLLKDFFSSTSNDADGGEEEEDEEYESDGGTKYVKDPKSGAWINSKLVEMRKATLGTNQKSKKRKQPSSIDPPSTSAEGNENETQKYINKKANAAGLTKKKKPKFKAKNAKCWVYVTGLPHDTDEEEVANFFSKVGLLDIDPESQKPKIKLYRYKRGDTINLERENMAGEKVTMPVPVRSGTVKGDASICFARAESVELAIQLLDDTPFRTIDSNGRFIENKKIHHISVQRAKFEQHGNKYHPQKRAVSNAKRKVARVAILQAVGWDDGENGRITGGLKGLCIVVLKYMFDANKLLQMDEEQEDIMLKAVESSLRNECEKWGHVEKITVFSKNPEGVVIVKFAQPIAASKAIEYYNGKEGVVKGRKIEAMFWDGVTDFTVRNEEVEKKEMDERLDAFGNWLDGQDLPEEFQLQVEGS